MFKPYLHVERLGTDATEGLLNNEKVFVTAKVDGTNACCWYDANDQSIHTGSRKREISFNDDNAGFAAWLLRSGDAQATDLRLYLKDHPNHIIYGEWMGSSHRFIGAIKDYAQTAHAHLYVFDVFDKESLSYLPEQEWRQLFEEYGLQHWTVSILAILDHPTIDMILSIAKQNNFLFSNDIEHPGEGVVCKVDNFLDPYGHPVRGKLVLDEYRQNKRKSKKVMASGEIEKDIIETYVTDAELSKTREKVNVTCNTDAFDITNHKMVGMMMSLVWKDLLGECPNFAKKFKNPIIDFSALKALCDTKTREYLGL